MAVGLRVRNQGTGQIQIGAGYRNLQLAKSGTLDTGSFQGRSTGGSPPRSPLRLPMGCWRALPEQPTCTW